MCHFFIPAYIIYRKNYNICSVFQNMAQFIWYANVLKNICWMNELRNKTWSNYLSVISLILYGWRICDDQSCPKNFDFRSSNKFSKSYIVRFVKTLWRLCWECLEGWKTLWYLGKITQCNKNVGLSHYIDDFQWYLWLLNIYEQFSRD